MRLARRYFGRLFFCDNIDIPTTCYHVPVQPKIFAGKSLNPVAYRGISNLPHDSDTEARPLKQTRRKYCNKMFILKFFSEIRQPEKLGAFQ